METSAHFGKIGSTHTGLRGREHTQKSYFSFPLRRFCDKYLDSIQKKRLRELNKTALSTELLISYNQFFKSYTVVFTYYVFCFM
ncbi:MAG: hypothetical protein RSC04_02840 [Bacteroidales bacterium]